jgi:hypothetical protein
MRISWASVSPFGTASTFADSVAQALPDALPWSARLARVNADADA